MICMGNMFKIIWKNNITDKFPYFLIKILKTRYS